MGGDAAQFFPDGVQNGTYDVLLALNYGLMVLSWYENLPDEEQPPREIWWSEELLDEWFEKVKVERGSGRKKKRSPYEEADDAPMSENEYATGLRP